MTALDRLHVINEPSDFVVGLLGSARWYKGYPKRTLSEHERVAQIGISRVPWESTVRVP